MKVLILGSGTSQGIPIIGCRCAACTSSNPKDKRLRVSVYIEVDNPAGESVKILIDTSPDFRQQLLTHNVTDLDSVIYTHHHIDHIMGFDDIRQINQLHKKSVDIYANIKTLDRLKRTFSYAFDEDADKGGGVPRVNAHKITLEKFNVSGVEIIPIEYHHGSLMVFGYRIGDFAYLTDCSKIPEHEFEKLENLQVLVLDALRFSPHPKHFSIDEAVESAKRIGAKKTYFTHMTHDVVHDLVNAQLPNGIELAYDGLTFEV